MQNIRASPRFGQLTNSFCKPRHPILCPTKICNYSQISNAEYLGLLRSRTASAESLASPNVTTNRSEASTESIQQYGFSKKETERYIRPYRYTSARRRHELSLRKHTYSQHCFPSARSYCDSRLDQVSRVRVVKCRVCVCVCVSPSIPPSRIVRLFVIVFFARNAYLFVCRFYVRKKT